MMNERRTTNLLLAVIVGLQLWQVLSSAAPVGASDAQEVRIVGHEIRKWTPLPVMIVAD